MQKDIWQIDEVTKNMDIPWPCPYCNIGILKLKDKSLQHFETTDSKLSRHSPDFEFEWIEYCFSAVLICNNTKCAETICVVGSGNVHGSSVEYTDEPGVIKQEYYVMYKPLFFYPPLHIFKIPMECPDTIKEETIKAFSLYWHDKAACANRIRTTVESIMNKAKVKTISVVNKRRRELTLHERILTYKEREPEIADYLLALKWIGNWGSHIGKLDRDDILDSFEILEHVFTELYVKKTKRIKQITREIIKRKGPRPKYYPVK